MLLVSHRLEARVRMEARSKRKPSMRYSMAQWRRQSTMKRRTTGWLQFSVLPQPE
jgi:hypothetical protein